MTNQPFAEVFPVHEHLADELEARGWMPADLAGAMGTAEEVVASLLRGELELSDELAIQLGDALGTSADLWLNLQELYQQAT